MGLFGRRPTDGFAARAAMDNPDAGRMMPAAGYVPPKRTFLDKLGLLADAFSGNDMNRRQLEQQDMQAFQMWNMAQRPEQEFQQWRRQEDYRRDNPAPSSPYRWESNDGSLMEVGADGQPRTVYKDPTPKINWIRADNGDGTFQMVPVGPQGPMTPQTQQPAAGGILKSLPPGVKPIGGAGSGGSRTFPIR